MLLIDSTEIIHTHLSPFDVFTCGQIGLELFRWFHSIWSGHPRIIVLCRTAFSCGGIVFDQSQARYIEWVLRISLDGRIMKFIECIWTVNTKRVITIMNSHQLCEVIGRSLGTLPKSETSHLEPHGRRWHEYKNTF
jgi:hypothetical protein